MKCTFLITQGLSRSVLRRGRKLVLKNLARALRRTQVITLLWLVLTSFAPSCSLSICWLFLLWDESFSSIRRSPWPLTLSLRSIKSTLLLCRAGQEEERRSLKDNLSVRNESTFPSLIGFVLFFLVSVCCFLSEGHGERMWDSSSGSCPLVLCRCSCS